MQHGAISVGQAHGPAPTRLSRFSLKHMIGAAAAVAVVMATTIHFTYPRASSADMYRAMLARQAMQQRYMRPTAAMPPMMAPNMDMMAGGGMPPAYRAPYAPRYDARAYAPRAPMYNPQPGMAEMMPDMYNEMSAAHGFIAINSCATLVGKGVCTGEMTQGVEIVRRQCTKGLKATECVCEGIKKKNIKSPKLIIGGFEREGLCRCMFQEMDSEHQYWKMSLKCEEA